MGLLRKAEIKSQVLGHSQFSYSKACKDFYFRSCGEEMEEDGLVARQRAFSRVGIERTMDCCGMLDELVAVLVYSSDR